MDIANSNDLQSRLDRVLEDNERLALDKTMLEQALERSEAATNHYKAIARSRQHDLDSIREIIGDAHRFPLATHFDSTPAPLRLLDTEPNSRPLPRASIKPIATPLRNTLGPASVDPFETRQGVPRTAPSNTARVRGGIRSPVLSPIRPEGVQLLPHLVTPAPLQLGDTEPMAPTPSRVATVRRGSRPPKGTPRKGEIPADDIEWILHVPNQYGADFVPFTDLPMATEVPLRNLFEQAFQVKPNSKYTDKQARQHSAYVHMVRIASRSEQARGGWCVNEKVFHAGRTQRAPDGHACARCVSAFHPCARVVAHNDCYVLCFFPLPDQQRGREVDWQDMGFWIIQP